MGFFREQRLGFQLELAATNGYTGKLQSQGARLLKRLPVFFEGHAPSPALLHGDLWGGNWGSCDGEPVIFDPAVYYGDPESDLAMTRLFGGFGPAFYEAYATVLPPASGSHQVSRSPSRMLDAGWPARVESALIVPPAAKSVA